MMYYLDNPVLLGCVGVY